jgi:hypothetical protein
MLHGPDQRVMRRKKLDIRVLRREIGLVVDGHTEWRHANLVEGDPEIVGGKRAVVVADGEKHLDVLSVQTTLGSEGK